VNILPLYFQFIHGYNRGMVGEQRLVPFVDKGTVMGRYLFILAALLMLVSCDDVGTKTLTESDLGKDDNAADTTVDIEEQDVKTDDSFPDDLTDTAQPDNDSVNESDVIADNDAINIVPLNIAWIKQCPDIATVLAVDEVNIYTAGATALALDENTNTGLDDVFLTKWSNEGTEIWTKQWGSTENDDAFSVAARGSNIFIAGITEGSFDGNTLPAPGYQDSFLLRTDTNGAPVWIKQWGAGAWDTAASVAIDNSNDTYTTGSLDEFIEPNYYSDIFLQKRNDEGNLLWEKQWGTGADDYGVSVVMDSEDYIYVTGSTMLSLDGNINPNEGWHDVFLTKWDSSGTKLWTKQWGTVEVDHAQKMVIDDSDNIYITGNTDGSFDGYTNVGGKQDIFLTKLDTEGSMIWTVQWGTDKNEDVVSVAVSRSGSIFVAGRTEGVLDGNTKIGSYDIFLTKWNANGTKAWTKQWGTEKMDWVYDMVTDSSDNIYLVGYGPLDINSSSSENNYAPFLMKILPEE